MHSLASGYDQRRQRRHICRGFHCIKRDNGQNEHQGHEFDEKNHKVHEALGLENTQVQSNTTPTQLERQRNTAERSFETMSAGFGHAIPTFQSTLASPAWHR